MQADAGVLFPPADPVRRPDGQPAAETGNPAGLEIDQRIADLDEAAAQGILVRFSDQSEEGPGDGAKEAAEMDLL